MRDYTKRYLIAVILLSITAFLTFGAYSTRSYSGVFYTQNIPMVIGDWYGTDIPIDERTYEILETRDVFMRQYVNSKNEKVLFTVVFARSNRKVAHPPEICFSGGGWSSDKDAQTIELGGRILKVNRLILQRGSEKQVALYLYKAGGKLTPNYYAQQLNIILNGMLRKSTSSALIRISSYAEDSDVREATARIRRFAEEAIPILEKYLP